MTKSKSKVRSAHSPRYFAAVHQDHLMEAFARGFVAPQSGGLVAEASVTQQAIDRARGDALWGDVVLVEVAGIEDRSASVDLVQPLLLTEVVACWVRSADVASEIEARLETFDDTIPAAVEIKVGPNVFPQAANPVAQEALPLATDASDAQAATAPARNAVALEKIAGAISMIRSRAKDALVPIGLVEQMLAVPQRQGRAQEDAIKDVAMHVYRVLRPNQVGSGDEQIFVAAAHKLLGTTPKDGIEPVSFVEQFVADEESRAFVDTLRKVMDNRIELSDSKLDDSGMVGQRALLVFLLAPRADELERWMRARPVGPIVSTLASVLAGLYCGLGTISRSIKGPRPSALLGAVDAARMLLAGESPSLRLERHWDPSARLEERLGLGNFDFVERTTAPSEELATLLGKARRAGLETMVDPQTGEPSVSRGDGTTIVKLTIATSTLRIPSSTIAILTFNGRAPKRGQLPKEMVSALLSESLRPAVASIDAAGEVRLTVEMDLAADIADGVSKVLRGVESLGLVQDTKAPKKPAKSKRASKTPSDVA